jgi:hypothetical protein
MNILRTYIPNGIVIGVCIVALAFWYSGGSAEEFAEARTITENISGFEALSDRFASLAKEKGGVYAYEVLLRAPLPPNTDIHLLGHVVGDELYKEMGISGMAHCTPDFRNACSHTIVIGALNEFGEEIIEKVRSACHKAPGGSGAYTMCFHGFGHGVFSYFDYDLAKTIAYCSRTGTKEYREREYIECVGGAVMELVGGGTHDPEGIRLAREKYLSTVEPLLPCSSSLVPADAKGICYMYISPHLFQVGGANLAAPDDASIQKAFSYCSPILDSKLAEECYGGIGKEFPLLALARDTRAINEAGEAELTQMHRLCGLAPDDAAHGACIRAVVDSLFWGSENDPRISIGFCHAGEAWSGMCFDHLYAIAGFYLPKEGTARADFCSHTGQIENCMQSLQAHPSP